MRLLVVVPSFLCIAKKLIFEINKFEFDLLLPIYHYHYYHYHYQAKAELADVRQALADIPKYFGLTDRDLTVNKCNEEWEPIF